MLDLTPEVKEGGLRHFAEIEIRSVDRFCPGNL